MNAMIAATAKVKAMNAKLLAADDYATLSKMESETEVIEWLRAKDYSKNIEQSAIHICKYITDKNQRSYIKEMAATKKETLHYYTAQWKRLSLMDSKNRTALRSILGQEIDLNNILWMYRLKKYHRIKGDATYGYLIPIRYKLNRQSTGRMADSQNPKALMEEVAQGPYASVFAKLVNSNKGSMDNEPIGMGSIPNSSFHPSLEQMLRFSPEHMLAITIEGFCQTIARRYPTTLAVVVLYLYKRKMEASRITAILNSQKG